MKRKIPISEIPCARQQLYTFSYSETYDIQTVPEHALARATEIGFDHGDMTDTCQDDHTT